MFGFLVLSLVLLLSSFGMVFAQPTHLIIGQGADMVSLDPHTTNDQPSARVRVQVYDTLVISDEDMNLHPGLAESWAMVDELTMRFNIRRGVQFHNGETLTAHDVKFTLDRLKDPATRADGAFIVGAITKVTVVDDYTVDIHTDKPFAPLLSHLAHTVTSILNEKSVVEAGQDYGTSVAVGTGPFVFVRWAAGSFVELKKNPNYWNGEAIVDRVTFRAIPENTVRAIEVETGGVDIAYDLDPMDEQRLELDPNIQIIKYDSFSTTYVGLNCQKAPYDNVLVRRAINHAIDVEAAVEYIFTGQATQNAGPIGANVWGANTDLSPYGLDPAKAKALLAEAGYPNGFRTTIWTNDNPIRMQVAELFQADLANIGVTAVIEVLPWGTYLEETGAGRHDMFILGWGTVTGDADYGLYALFHSSQMGSAGNRTFYSNPRVDELLELGRSTLDPNERFAFYQEAQQNIVADAPWVFLFSQSYANGVRNNVSNFVPHPTGSHRLMNVVKK